MATLAQMNENLGLKRRELAAAIDTQKANYEAIDTLESQIDALAGKAERTEAENTELTKLQASHSAKAKESRDTIVKVQSLQNDVSGLQAKISERENFETLVQASNSPGQTRSGVTQPSEPLRVQVLPPTKEELSLDIGYLVQAHYISNRDKVSVRTVLAGKDGYEEFKNDRLSAATTSNNAAIVPTNYARTLIELLRPKTVIRSMDQIRNIPLVNGNVTLPRQATGSTASWTNEAANITASDVTTETITLSAKKLTVLVPVSGELMRRSDPAVAAMLRDDLVNQAARAQDIAFIRNGTAGAPIGIKALVDAYSSAANRVDASALSTFTTPTLAVQGTTSDLGKLQLKLNSANVPMGHRYWIISPRTEQYLMDLRDANGNLAYPEMQRGKIKQYDYVCTSAIPENLTVTIGSSRPNSTEIYLVEASELLVADTPTMDLQVSDSASWWDGSALQSAYSKDMHVARLIQECDFNVRHPVAIAYLQGVNWA